MSEQRKSRRASFTEKTFYGKNIEMTDCITSFYSNEFLFCYRIFVVLIIIIEYIIGLKTYGNSLLILNF